MSEKNESTLFRKKPVVVQAVQYPCEHPALRRCDCDGNSACSSCGLEYIETLEGCMNVSPGDWIITGVQGEHYPCKPDIFAATYEPANAPTSSAPGDAQDERQAFEAWMTSQGQGFLRDGDSYSLTYARRAWDAWQARARIDAPAAGDALAVEDHQHLNWMIAEECRIETLTLGNGTRYRVHWPDVDEHQAEWFFSPGGAIRAAIAQQKGEA
jgi:hypothetical protein